MALSNAQGLLFAEISTEEVRVEGPPVTTLKGWFGAQQVGQIKSLITNTVNENKGVVTHTVGDSILSSFADAQSALSAALGIQRRVAKAQNPSTGMIVKVRIGLAYGPVRVMAGKVSGDSVTAAGVLLEKAQANEILADQAVLDAVGTPKETRFEACGLVEGVTAYRVVSLAATPGQPPAATPAPGPQPAAKPAPAASASEAPAPRAAAAATLTLKYAGGERRFAPADGEVFMGRGKDVHITVPEIHVSRKHAKIVWEAGTPFLVNLSQNGTCVRFTGTGREQTCMTKVALEGSGDIVLCSRFSQIASPGEIIAFSVAAR
ncbi:MAG: FHA domain-containing protein [Proteobacteria bacterium]|nr:FHA domain-containing protein [Pseudomonadota bacterium]